LRKTAETEISDLTFWPRFGSVRVFINRNRTEIRFPHIPTTQYRNQANGMNVHVHVIYNYDTGEANDVESGLGLA